MPKEVNPKDTKRAAAYELWMKAIGFMSDGTISFIFFTLSFVIIETVLGNGSYESFIVLSQNKHSF